MALVIVRRADSIKSLAESLAFQQAFIFISNTILATNRFIGIRAGLAFRVVDEAWSFLGEGVTLALQDAQVVVGLLFASADGGVGTGAVNAVVFIWAFSIALSGDSSALALTFVEVGLSINAAFRDVNFGAVLTVGLVQVAETVVELPDTLAVEKAFIVIGDSISAADGNIGEGLRTTAV